MLRRLLPLALSLVLALSLAGCGQPPAPVGTLGDPVLARAARAYAAVTSYRTTGTITMPQGQLVFTMDHVVPDRSHLTLVDRRDGASIELLAIGMLLYARSGGEHWETVAPASAGARQFMALIQRARMVPLSVDNAIPAGEQMVADERCRAYQLLGNDEHVTTCVSIDSGLVLKTEATRDGTSIVLTYDHVNQPIEINTPYKSLTVAP